MKVVIDTNVLLVIIPSLSRYHLAYEALKQNHYDVAVSNEILLEYEEQLSLRYDISDASEILQNLLENQNIQLYNPEYKWNLIPQDPAFFFLPFSIVMIVNGYPVVQVLSWHVAIMALVFADNYLNLLMDNLDRLFVAVLVVLVSFAALQYYGWLDITMYSGPVFQAFYEYPLFGFGMLIIPVLLYRYCFAYFKNNLRTDETVQPKVKEAQIENFTWLEKF